MLRRLRNNYACLQALVNYACLQALVNNALTWQSSCVMANNGTKTSKSYLSEAIISVHDVMQYTKYTKTSCRFCNYDCLQALVNNALTWQSSCGDK